jgi:hypothetical protein
MHFPFAVWLRWPIRLLRNELVYGYSPSSPNAGTIAQGRPSVFHVCIQFRQFARCALRSMLTFTIGPEIQSVRLTRTSTSRRRCGSSPGRNRRLKRSSPLQRRLRGGARRTGLGPVRHNCTPRREQRARRGRLLLQRENDRRQQVRHKEHAPNDPLPRQWQPSVMSIRPRRE